MAELVTAHLFNDDNLTEVSVYPSSVGSGGRAFRACTSSKHVRFEEAVEQVISSEREGSVVDGLSFGCQVARWIVEEEADVI